MNSLRARQLLSTLGIALLVILLITLSIKYYKDREVIQDRWIKLQDTTESLLGFFRFERGRFIIEESELNNLQNFLDNKDFALKGNEAQLAYLEHISTKEVQWHSYEPMESKEIINRKVELLTRFKIEDENVNKDFAGKLKPIERERLRELNKEYASNYAVRAMTFEYPPFGKYRLVVASNLQKYEENQNTQNKLLIIVFFVSILLIIISQMALSFWVVAPIQDFEQEIKEIEAHNQDFIAESYPDELTPIKNAINALLHHEKGQKQRYQDTLDDLAHSLKTPLAAMQGFIEQEKRSGHMDEKRLNGLKTQLERMNDIIAYQLRRAVVKQHSSMIPSQAVLPVIKRLSDSLNKVYRDKNIHFALELEPHHTCRLEYDDMMELFGNLLNNACRFCEATVAVTAHFNNDMLVIDIDDDGMGFPENNPSKLLQRGIRADSKSEGQGIGLAVCTEIVAAAGGKIELLTSPEPYLGARVQLSIPV
jgi:signal transduction histidine kinase